MTAFATAGLAPALGGVQPVRPVATFCVLQRGIQPGLKNVLISSGGLRDLTVEADALSGGRRTVLERLRAEAERLGADGVAGVSLSERDAPWIDHGVQFRASGTAVRGVAPGRLTNLGPSELETLHRAGASVAGLVEHSTVVAVLGGPETRELYRYGRHRSNFEMPDFTRGFAEVRAAAIASLRAQAKDLDADGLLALDLAVRPRWDHEHRKQFSENVAVLECRALATAVVDRSSVGCAPPRLALDLRRVS